MQCIDIAQKNHSSGFLSEAGTDQKIIPNGKKTTALTNFLVRNRHKNFWPSKLGGRINLETFQKFRRKKKIKFKPTSW
jgi:hypothetical protein